MSMTPIPERVERLESDVERLKSWQVDQADETAAVLKLGREVEDVKNEVRGLRSDIQKAGTIPAAFISSWFGSDGNPTSPQGLVVALGAIVVWLLIPSLQDRLKIFFDTLLKSRGPKDPPAPPTDPPVTGSTNGSVNGVVHRTALESTSTLALCLAAVALSGCGGGTPGAKSPDYLSIASRVLGTAQGCLDGFLAREEKKCEGSDNRDACLADAQDRWLKIQEDVAVIRASTCSDESRKLEFAGVCE